MPDPDPDMGALRAEGRAPHAYMDGHELPLSEAEIGAGWERLAEVHAAGEDTVTVSLREMARLLLSLDALLAPPPEPTGDKGMATPAVGLSTEQRAVVEEWRSAWPVLAAGLLAVIDDHFPPAAVDREERGK